MTRRHLLAVALSLVAGCGGETTEANADAGTNEVPLRVKLDGASTAFGQASAAVHGSFTQIAATRGAESQSIELSFPGAALGSFSCADGATFEYRPTEATRYAALGGEGSCAIEVTAYGEVGEPVAGSFSGTLIRLAGTGPSQISMTEGAFDVERSADLP